MGQKTALGSHIKAIGN